MTEQEKREKAIDEMERDVDEAIYVPIYNDNGDFQGYRKLRVFPTIAARLISKGYRKQKEVRKETIKEFISFVKNVIDNYKPTVTVTDSGIKTYHYLTDDGLFDIIKEKYSAEVEE